MNFVSFTQINEKLIKQSENHEVVWGYSCTTLNFQLLTANLIEARFDQSEKLIEELSTPSKHLLAT